MCVWTVTNTNERRIFKTCICIYVYIDDVYNISYADIEDEKHKQTTNKICI